MNNTSSTELNLPGQQPNLGKEYMAKLLPIAIAITLTNGLVFVMFYRRKNLRNSSNYLLLGLAVCDFLTGALNIPYFIIFSFQVVPRTSPIYKDFAIWMYILHTLMSVSAAYHILVITAEKYLAIVQPLRHHLVTKKTVFKVLAGVWAVSGFIATIPYAWQGLEYHSQFLWYIIHSTACLVIVFLVPYVFMVYAYTVMFKAVSGRTRPSRHRLRSQKKNNNDRKCILVFATMATVYLCCWCPYFTLMLTVNVVTHNNSTAVSVAFSKVLEVFVIVRYLTSVTNPLLYAFFKRDFWLALRSFTVRRRSRFAERRTWTLRSFSLGFSSAKSRSRSIQDSTRSVDSTKSTRLSLTAGGNLNMEFEGNEQINSGEFVAFMSSV